MQQFRSWQPFTQHWQALIHTQQRQLLVLPECEATYQRVLPMLAAASQLPAIGVNLPSLSDQAAHALGPNASYIKANQAKQMLGLNRGLLVYRAVDEFNVSAFSALCGTLVGGSFAVLVVPSDKPWHLAFDQQVRDFGCQGNQAGAFKHWWQGVWQQTDAVAQLEIAAQEQAANYAPTKASLMSADISLNTQQLTLVDKVIALQASDAGVIWVTGARGRGKTHAVLHALTQLHGLGGSYLVTASASHNSRMLGQVKQAYVAVDQLLADEQQQAHMLFVEEAASMPLYLLQRLLKRFRKLVLISTVDGYEGSGQGLRLKLPDILDSMAIDWQQMELCEPLRWSVDDHLEQLIETSFLPRQLDAVDTSVDLSNCVIKVMTGAQLLHDPVMLDQIYALLAMAHYQTTPQDLRLLLDHPHLTLHLCLSGEGSELLAVACCLREGQLDSDLAQQIANGKRRIKGHLLAQILAQQAGMASLAEASVVRVQRIAVHPQLQGQGLGSLLLQEVKAWCQQHKIDYLGSSFAAEPKIVQFWLRSGYQPVWAGLKADAASGLPSLQVLMPMQFNQANRVNDAARLQFLALRQHWYFYQQLVKRFWPQGLSNSLLPAYKGIPRLVVHQLLQQVGHQSGNPYALAGYLLQWVLQQPRLDSHQRHWLHCFNQMQHQHKPFVAASRTLIQHHQLAIEASIDAGLLALKVDHPKGS